MKKLRRRVEKFNGLSVGLDLHKQFIQVSVFRRPPPRHGDSPPTTPASSCASHTRHFMRDRTLEIT